jgi:signal transduction histidine kinase
MSGAWQPAVRGLRALVTGPDAAGPAAPGRRRAARVVARVGRGAAVVAGVVITSTTYEYVVDHGYGHPLVALAMSGLTGLPLALLPWRPLLAWRVAWLYLVVAGVVLPMRGDTQPWPWSLTQVLAYGPVLFVLCARLPRAVVVWAWLATVLVAATFIEYDVVPVVVVLVTVAVVLADQVRARRQAQRALAVAAERSELGEARRAVLEERARIARELHDVVAHHMSLVAVRAETAPYRLPGDDVVPAVAAEFAGIATISREALTEMRRLLGVLRGDEAAPAAPQPGLDDIDALVAAARGAGVAVTLALARPAGPVPPGVALSAYRIVQEALSNARRHAAGAPVHIDVSGDGADLRVEVANGPGAAPAAVAARADRADALPHGLVGLRERVAMLGGHCDIGPAPDGGFVVRAVLPLGAGGT